MNPTKDIEIATEINLYSRTKIFIRHFQYFYFFFNFLKYIKDEVIPALVTIFNKYITEGIFPAMLKTAKVIPIFRKRGVTSF